jgi:hypothetical protein
MEIDGIDEEPALEVVKSDIPHQVLDQHFEGFAPIEGRGEESAKGDISSGNLEDVAPANQAGSSLHVAGGNSSSPGGGNQGANARTDDQTGYQVTFF